MKGAVPVLLPLILVSCGNGGPRINIDVLQDAGGDAMGDILAPVDAIENDLILDTSPDVVADGGADTSGTSCEETLRTWMCGAQGCQPDHSCAGYAPGCAEAPCWGAWCAFIPGFCLPSMTDGTCTKPADCETGYTCVKGIFSQSGICTFIGNQGLCLSNQDCVPGETCAGEVVNHVGSPGYGPQMPGICMATADDGCWDDGQCAGGWCSGAVLCMAGDTACTPAAGACVAGDPPGCEPADGGQGECAGSEWGNWCVGADGYGSRWCAPPPAGPAADGQCWEDRECSPATSGNVCRSSLACPPRAFCRVSGFHSGVCGAAPAAGEGLTLKFVDQTPTGEVTLSQTSRILLINRGPVGIFILPCDTVPVYAQKDGAWDGASLSWGFSTAECATLASTRVMLRLAPGSGMVMTLTPGDLYDGVLAGRRIRLGLDYWLGCEPGGTTDGGMDCVEVSNGLGRRMFSPDVLWKNGG